MGHGSSAQSGHPEPDSLHSSFAHEDAELLRRLERLEGTSVKDRTERLVYLRTLQRYFPDDHSIDPVLTKEMVNMIVDSWRKIHSGDTPYLQAEMKRKKSIAITCFYDCYYAFLEDESPKLASIVSKWGIQKKASSLIKAITASIKIARDHFDEMYHLFQLSALEHEELHNLTLVPKYIKPCVNALRYAIEEVLGDTLYNRSMQLAWQSLLSVIVNAALPVLALRHHGRELARGPQKMEDRWKHHTSRFHQKLALLDTSEYDSEDDEYVANNRRSALEKDRKEIENMYTTTLGPLSQFTPSPPPPRHLYSTPRSGEDSEFGSPRRFEVIRSHRSLSGPGCAPATPVSLPLLTRTLAPTSSSSTPRRPSRAQSHSLSPVSSPSLSLPPSPLRSHETDRQSHPLNDIDSIFDTSTFLQRVRAKNNARKLAKSRNRSCSFINQSSISSDQPSLSKLNPIMTRHHVSHPSKSAFSIRALNVLTKYTDRESGEKYHQKKGAHVRMEVTNQNSTTSQSSHNSPNSTASGAFVLYPSLESPSSRSDSMQTSAHSSATSTPTLPTLSLRDVGPKPPPSLVLRDLQGHTIASVLFRRNNPAKSSP